MTKKAKHLARKLLPIAAGIALSTPFAITQTVAADQRNAADDIGAALSFAKDFPTDLIKGADKTQQALYAWSLFSASMQPTLISNSFTGQQPAPGRGEAITPKNPGILGGLLGAGEGFLGLLITGRKPLLNNALVFESFYHRTEAFPHYTGGKPSSPIDKTPVYRTYYKNEAGNKVELAIENANYVYLDETNQIGQNFLYYQHSHNSDFPVLFMAKVNKLETQYALGELPSSPTMGPSRNSSWDFPDGVVEVKTAWRRVKDIKHSDPHTYHQAMATYYTTTGEGAEPVKHTEPFALIAIHIIQKTANYPEFIFTTFEHVDAVTRTNSHEIIDPAYKTTYNQLSYQSVNGVSERPSAKPSGAYAMNVEGMHGAINQVHTYHLPSPGSISKDYTTVTQPYTITAEVNDVNNAVAKAIKRVAPNNIWANYRLKGVQTVPTSDETSGDYYLANIVVESSQPGIQLFTGVLLYGGVPQTGMDGLDYFVNCRGPSDAQCVYPAASGLSGSASTFNNTSFHVEQGKPVPAATVQMGGCQGCHAAAQQLGRDFSFLANGFGGKGKELDAVPASDLDNFAIKAINRRMAVDGNIHN